MGRSGRDDSAKRGVMTTKQEKRWNWRQKRSRGGFHRMAPGQVLLRLHASVTPTYETKRAGTHTYTHTHIHTHTQNTHSLMLLLNVQGKSGVMIVV